MFHWGYQEHQFWRPERSWEGLRETFGALLDYSFVPNDYRRYRRDVPVFGSLFTLLLAPLMVLRARPHRSHRGCGLGPLGRGARRLCHQLAPVVADPAAVGIDHGRPEAIRADGVPRTRRQGRREKRGAGNQRESVLLHTHGHPHWPGVLMVSGDRPIVHEQEACRAPVTSHPVI